MSIHPTPNSELRTVSQRKHSFDEVLLQLTQVGLSAQPTFPRKVLFWGERAVEISSYVAGWLAGKGEAVIVLDGANRFDPYTVSSLARRAWIPPERLLKSIRIARAFTCYQMATLMGEKLTSLLGREGTAELRQKTWVILLGPLTTFLDEDVSEREARSLFERSLRKTEAITSQAIPFLLFQSDLSSPPLRKGGAEGFMGSKGAYLMKRLFQFSNEAWRVDLDEEGPKIVLEKGVTELQIADCGSRIEASEI
jgi:hypothetical protein